LIYLAIRVIVEPNQPLEPGNQEVHP
jgi:hypothetical protein